ncbi:MAG TPA: phosphate ABC transporter phosphate-binding protein, partial [Candidatus Scatomorpha intestinigallinarum]|nr:phosphate ABC transporter phosphate-binding protein [Candidatus Scatomorpha intestinigallinarum]
MKKTLAIALALVCCLGLLAACGEPASDPSEAPASEAPASEAP